MSLILEALRKSEAERRRGQAPDVAVELPPVAPAASRHSPAWLWPVLTVVVLLLALGAWLATHPSVPTRDADTIAAAADTDAQPSHPVARAPSLAPPAPRVVARAPSTASIPPPTRPAPPAPVATAPVPRPLTPPARIVAPIPAPPPPRAAANEVPDIASTGLPPVKLSMHMWNEDPARRFVILDGKRMGEGDRINGISVLAIDHKGVVIERNGQRARIPLQ